MNLPGKRILLGAAVATAALGIGGIAYAAGDDPATPEQGYVTIEEGATTPSPSTGTGTGQRNAEDCPEKNGGSGQGQGQGQGEQTQPSQPEQTQPEQTQPSEQADPQSNA